MSEPVGQAPATAAADALVLITGKGPLVEIHWQPFGRDHRGGAGPDGHRVGRRRFSLQRVVVGW